ncbi:MAG: hypothetical protein HC836_42130 [Richelia sp. RM2_1_2]|nr:hypothetical protein [Richelia sp. RM2_1_2]
MKNIIEGNKVGNVVNVVINGSLLSKACSTPEQAKKLFSEVLMTKKNPTDNAIHKLKQALQGRYLKPINSLINYDQNTKEYYYKDYDVAMPKGLADAMIDYVDNNYPTESLESFWSLLITNPNKEVREKLFHFLSTYHFTITENGYVVAYKAVTHTTKVDNDLATFVSNQFFKIKKRKKSPAKYSILRDSKKELFLVETSSINLGSDNAKEYVGTLKDLFGNIGNLNDANSTKFTDKYTQKMNIKLGVPVKEDRGKCDPNPLRECSNGLHVGSTKYVETFANKNDTVLLVLFNPQHVVAVPNHDNSKMRVCEYFPLAVLERRDRTFETVDTPFVEFDYMNYEKGDVQTLINVLQDKVVNEPQNVTIDEEQRLKILKNRLVDLNRVKMDV